MKELIVAYWPWGGVRVWLSVYVTIGTALISTDVSIWLNQAVKGMRDSRGDPLPHAHLVVLFNRVCKLLHYKIKPVFVFDGATPSLKRQTLVAYTACMRGSPCNYPHSRPSAPNAVSRLVNTH